MTSKFNSQQWAVDMQKCLATIGACEAKEYADYDQEAFYQFSFGSWTDEEEAQFEREVLAAQLRRGDMFNAIRQFVIGSPRTSESQQRLEQISAAAAISLKVLSQEVLGEYVEFEGRQVDAMSLPEYALYERLMTLNADQWETVESVSARKGVSDQVLRRLLRDDDRRAQYFPSARNPQAWQLRRAEVDAWQPAAVGRPPMAMQIDIGLDVSEQALGLEDSECDIEQSRRRLIAQVTSAIQQRYPRAEVEVRAADRQRILVNDRTDADEIDGIRSIIEREWGSWGWVALP